MLSTSTGRRQVFMYLCTRFSLDVAQLTPKLNSAELSDKATSGSVHWARFNLDNYTQVYIHTILLLLLLLYIFNSTKLADSSEFFESHLLLSIFFFIFLNFKIQQGNWESGLKRKSQALLRMCLTTRVNNKAVNIKSIFVHKCSKNKFDCLSC